MTAAVEVSGLTKAYGYRLALRGIDLVLPWGELLTVLGPNGSGKTTLIRVLAALASPTAGRVHIAGLELRREAERLHSLIGVMTHQTFLYDDLTGYENLQFYGRLFGLKAWEARTATLARQLALEPYLDLRVRTLSHGIQKRLSLARALLHEPRLLLLDEPETGLDQEALSLLETLLNHHRATGCSAIVTTHNIDHGLSIGDRVVILAEGRVAYEGAREALDTATFRQTYANLTGIQA